MAIPAMIPRPSALALLAASLVALAVISQTAVAQSPVAGIVTQAFFDGLKNQGGNCAGRQFYTRDAFINAANTFPDFGKGAGAESKREIAAFFAHVSHETGQLCYVEEINKANAYCDNNNKQYPCAPGKKYYGRGPLQLTWNYNYGAAGNALKLNLLQDPDIVAKDPVIAFRTALWFWMTNVHSKVSQGFGATIRAINSIECNGGNAAQVQSRIKYYRDLCGKLGVDPGANLNC